MRIKYNLTEDDYINFNMYHLKNSDTLKKSIMINRYVTPLIFLIIPFVLRKISNIPFWYWAVVFVITYILWVVLYEKNLYKINKKRILKMLKENSNEGLVGEKILDIDGEYIKSKSYARESTIHIKAIKNIKEDDNYIFIYINSIEAIIIPLSVFKNKEEKDNFKALLNA